MVSRFRLISYYIVNVTKIVDKVQRFSKYFLAIYRVSVRGAELRTQQWASEVLTPKAD